MVFNIKVGDFLPLGIPFFRLRYETIRAYEKASAKALYAILHQASFRRRLHKIQQALQRTL